MEKGKYLFLHIMHIRYRRIFRYSLSVLKVKANVRNNVIPIVKDRDRDHG